MSSTANGMINYADWLKVKHYQATPIRTALRTMRPDTIDEGFAGETERLNMQFSNALRNREGQLSDVGLIDGDFMSITVKVLMIGYLSLAILKMLGSRKRG